MNAASPVVMEPSHVGGTLSLNGMVVNHVLEHGRRYSCAIHKTAQVGVQDMQ